MELKYPDSYCKYSPTGAHWFLVLQGKIWRCHYCWAVKWQPMSWDEALNFSLDIRKDGIQVAYSKWLLYRPATKKILIKLEEIRVMKDLMPEEELLKVIAVIVLDKELGLSKLQVVNVA